MDKLLTEKSNILFKSEVAYSASRPSLPRTGLILLLARQQLNYHLKIPGNHDKYACIRCGHEWTIRWVEAD